MKKGMIYMEDKIQIDTVLNESCINLNLKANNKEEALDELVDMLYEFGSITSKEGFLHDIYLREGEGPTGIGGGIAIPHGKSEHVSKTSIAIGRIENFIPWESLDDKPVGLIILFAVRDIDKSKHVKLLSNVAVALSKDEVVKKLFTTDTEVEMMALFNENTN